MVAREPRPACATAEYARAAIDGGSLGPDRGTPHGGRRQYRYPRRYHRPEMPGGLVPSIVRRKSAPYVGGRRQHAGAPVGECRTGTNSAGETVPRRGAPVFAAVTLVRHQVEKYFETARAVHSS